MSPHVPVRVLGFGGYVILAQRRRKTSLWFEEGGGAFAVGEGRGGSPPYGFLLVGG